MYFSSCNMAITRLLLRASLSSVWLKVVLRSVTVTTVQAFASSNLRLSRRQREDTPLAASAPLALSVTLPYFSLTDVLSRGSPTSQCTYSPLLYIAPFHPLLHLTFLQFPMPEPSSRITAYSHEHWRYCHVKRFRAHWFLSSLLHRGKPRVGLQQCFSISALRRTDATAHCHLPLANPGTKRTYLIGSQLHRVKSKSNVSLTFCTSWKFAWNLETELKITFYFNAS